MFETALPNAKTLSIAPGRVNLLGEHVDYNGGAVLPAAIDRQVKLKADPREDRLVLLTALDLNQTVIFSLDQLESKQDVQDAPLPEWALYPAGVAWAAQQRGLPVTGLEGAFTSNIPIGSGLSSSAAVEVAFGAVWQEWTDWTMDRLALAQLCQYAENRYVGVNCGLMDQFACANGVEGHALYLDTRSLDWHPVPMPEKTVIIIADSKMRRSLQTSGYNDRRAACEQAVALLQDHLPAVRTLRDVSLEEFNHFAPRLSQVVEMRARHVVEEIARVDQAIPLLNAGNAAEFGRLMFECHASLRDLYQVSIPELDTLVEIAATLPGIYGARLTGAGFGGCTVNLVAEDQAESFIPALREGYRQRTGHIADVYLCRASQGVHTVPLG